MPAGIRSFMRELNSMSLAYETSLTTTPPRSAPEASLNITVVFTSVEPTLLALREAGRLADRLGGRITLVVPQIVPYPLPLTSPPVLIDWNERRFRVLAEESPVDTKVLLYLCRDRQEMLMAGLAPRSLVVLGGPKHWWPTFEKRLAKTLRRAGHEVIFKEWSKTRA